MKATFIFCILCLAIKLDAQNLVGLNEKEIMQYMNDNEKGFVYQNFTNNSTFRYLKYTDRLDTQTILFFLDRDLKCKIVRLVCEKRLKDKKIKELDDKYRKTGENSWMEVRNGISYLIEIIDEEVTFNITFRKNE